MTLRAVFPEDSNFNIQPTEKLNLNYTTFCSKHKMYVEDTCTCSCSPKFM